MPDRYLVTHAITKDVKNEDLRDFLQESIEECFQILDNGTYELLLSGLLIYSRHKKKGHKSLLVWEMIK